MSRGAVDFIGIGAQKAGTTWLWGMLRQHPDIAFGPVKEVHYFDVVHLGVERSRRLRNIEKGVGNRIESLRTAGAPQETIDRVARLMDRSFVLTDAWYEALFADIPADKVRGEITPLYSALPDAGIEHLKRLAPDARLVYLLRDPVQRGLSSLRHMIDKKHPLEMVLGLDHYFWRGDYRSNIPRWERHFPADQLLFLPFGDIKTQPMELLRSVERHLGLRAFDGYAGLDSPRGSTTGKEVVLPEGIEQRVAEIFAGQKDYLVQRFGADFVARTS